MGQGRVNGWRGACLAAALFLPACERQPQPPGSATNEEGAFTIDPVSGETTARVVNGSKTVTLRAGGEGDAALSPALPFGFTIYPRSEVERSTSVASAETIDALVAMRTDDVPNLVIEHYRAEAAAARFSTGMDLATQTTHALVGSGPEGAEFSVSAVRQAGGTMVRLRISSRSRPE